MAAWAQFLPDVEPWVPGCPRPVVEHSIRDAAIHFMADSRIDRRALTDIAVSAGDGDYPLVLPTGTVLVAINRASFAGNPLSPCRPDYVPPEWDDETGSPTAIFSLDGVNVSLRKVPDSSGTLSISSAVLKPSPSSTGCEDWIFNEFRLGIAAGALSLLLIKPSAPWGNPQAAESYGKIFQGYIGKAAHTGDRGHGRAPARGACFHIGRK